VFIPRVIAPLHDFTGVRFILFLRGIGEQAYIVVNIEIKKRSRLAARFVDDKVVECMVLNESVRQRDPMRVVHLHEG
jgi:hypothetical protein